MAADESFAAHCEGYGLEWIDKSSRGREIAEDLRAAVATAKETE